MDLNLGEVDWKKFIDNNGGNNGVTTPTPLYNVIANNFPIALTEKLVFIARHNDFDLSTRQRAAFLLKDMAEDPLHRLDDAYPTVDRETMLPYLRSCSLRLMLENERGSPFQKAGKALAKNLITLALHHGEEWDEFLELLQRGFSGEPHLVELIFDIFLVLTSFKMCLLFTLFVAPIVMQHHDQFRTGVIHLLQSDSYSRNYRGFKILLVFYFAFFNNQDHLNSVMKAAIMSPMFDYDPHPDAEIMVLSAKCIQMCIRFGPAFEFSSPMIYKMNDILDRLNASPDQPNGRTVAEELVNALRERLNLQF